MLQFRNILVVLGTGPPGQRTLLRRAVLVARRHGALLTAAGLVQKSHAPAPPPGDDVTGAVTHACRDTLEQLVEGLRNSVAVTTTVIGETATAIIREVLRNGHDLVIAAGDAGIGIRSAVFGSTSTRLLRDCPCPVWVLNRRERIPYRRVLAAVDLDSGDPAKTALNRRILEAAAAVAALDDTELHIAHAWNMEFERMLRNHSAPAAMRAVLRATRLQRQAELRTVVASFAGRQLDQVHLRKGDPSKVLPLLARRKGIDLIVIGAVRRTGITALLIDSTAEQVVSKLDCSVLGIKPDEFVTPVRLDRQNALEPAA